MKTRRWLLGIIVILAFGSVAAAQRVTGVWKLDERTTTGTDAKTEKMTFPSMYLFTKSHYSIIYTTKDRSTDDVAAMTADQLRDTFIQSFIANAGTYDVTAGKITFKPIVAKSPAFMKPGNWNRMRITVKGNTMTLVSDSTNEGPAKNQDDLQADPRRVERPHR